MDIYMDVYGHIYGRIWTLSKLNKQWFSVLSTVSDHPRIGAFYVPFCWYHFVGKMYQQKAIVIVKLQGGTPLRLIDYSWHAGFLLELFSSGGGKTIVMQISIVMLIFLVFLDKILEGGKVFKGRGKLPRGRPLRKKASVYTTGPFNSCAPFFASLTFSFQSSSDLTVAILCFYSKNCFIYFMDL